MLPAGCHLLRRWFGVLCCLQALSQQLSGSVSLYAELEQERETVASQLVQLDQLEQLRLNQEALINSLELQSNRLKEEVAYEQQLRKKLADQLQQANEVGE